MGEDGRVIDAVIFDLDGVLVDSEPVWERVRRRVVAEHGGTWPPEAQTRLMGMSTPEWARYLSVDLGVGLPPDEVAALVVRGMAGEYSRHLPALPGADAAVRRMAGQWPLALASSSARPLIDLVLAASGWAELFAVTVSTEEVARGKPEPDVYLDAVRRLGADPAGCLAVEDSSNGLRSARAAGTRVVAVPRPEYPPAADALDGADLVLHHLDELTVEAVRALG